MKIEVANGEIVDKLSILQIKLRKLKEAGKLREVRREIAQLQHSVDLILDRNHQYLLRFLTRVNTKIWDLEEQLRAEPDQQILQLIQKENDARFRLKRKINLISRSKIKEVKSYALRRLFLISHDGMGDLINMCGMVRYLAMHYDHLVLACAKYQQTARRMYANDPCIEIVEFAEQDLIVADEKNAENADDSAEPKTITRYQAMLNRYRAQGYDLLLLGYYHSKVPDTIRNPPYIFYKQADIPFSVHMDYFCVARDFERERKIADQIRQQANGQKYSFVHDVPQRRNCIDRRQKYKRPELYVYHPNRDLRKKNKKQQKDWIASDYIFDYWLAMEGASELHLLDSSFLCLAKQIDLSGVGVICVYQRRNYRLEQFLAGFPSRTQICSASNS